MYTGGSGKEGIPGVQRSGPGRLEPEKVGAGGRTHQAPVDVRVRPFGGGRRVLGVAQSLAGWGEAAAAAGRHGNAAPADSELRGAAYDRAAGTN